MPNPYQPAFARPGTSGLTKAEWFATFAPQEIPEWFQVALTKIKAPVKPKSWNEITGPDEDIKTLKDWQYGAIFDLPPHLSWYQEAWDKYNEEMSKYYNDLKSERYFEWRKYYSLKMCELL